MKCREAENASRKLEEGVDEAVNAGKREEGIIDDERGVSAIIILEM
jgi:hypothetical protein